MTSGPCPDGYTARMLRAMFPPPLRVVTGRSHRTDITAYLPLPTMGRTRIVVPAGHPVVAARAVHRQLTSRRRRTRVARMLLVGALGTGMLDALHPHRFVVQGEPDQDSLLSRLAGVLGSPVLMSFPVGPPRANRKPVLQLADHRGSVLAFAKVGHDPLTTSLVRREADALARLARVPLRRTRAPTVIETVQWRDFFVLLLEPLPVAEKQIGGQRRRDRLLECIQEIAALSDWRGRWSASALRGTLADRLSRLGDRAAALRTELALLDDADPDLWVGSWHGDLNPGNVAVREDGVLVWDWERFEDGLPVGFDLLHHDLHEQVTVAQVEPRAAAESLIRLAATTLRPLGVPPEMATVFARLYLVSLAARYLGDDQDLAGSVLGRVEQWLLPALTATRT